MPKKTFENLDPAKRERFTAVCSREFAIKNYRSASVSAIVEELGIAKGSVYQYFENKKDLYTYLIDLAANRKLDRLASRFSRNNGGGGLRSQLKLILLEGSIFDIDNPAESLLILNAMEEKEFPGSPAPSDRLRRQSEDFISAVIDKGIEDGELSDGIERSLLVHHLNIFSMSLALFLEKKYSFSLRELLTGCEEGKKRLPFTRDELENDIDGYTALFFDGAGRRN